LLFVVFTELGISRLIIGSERPIKSNHVS